MSFQPCLCWSAVSCHRECSHRACSRVPCRVRLTTFDLCFALTWRWIHDCRGGAQARCFGKPLESFAQLNAPDQHSQAQKAEVGLCFALSLFRVMCCVWEPKSFAQVCCNECLGSHSTPLVKILSILFKAMLLKPESDGPQACFLPSSLCRSYCQHKSVFLSLSHAALNIPHHFVSWSNLSSACAHGQ